MTTPKRPETSPPIDPLYREAIDRFRSLSDRAKETSLLEPAAATLATVDGDGQPDARVILLRGVDLRGFVFFTNARSIKGQQMADQPNVALCVHWDPIREQVRIQGPVEATSEQENDTYWSSRPRERQIGAWASLQSEPLDQRETLEARYVQFEQQYAGQDVPRPSHWQGYRVVPSQIEFWSNRDARLHERVVYRDHDGTWTKGWLYP